MFEIITIAIFIWLLAKSLGFMVKLTWGVAKLVAGILMVLALPVLIVCLVFAGGLVLLVPLVMIALAAGLLRLCL